MQATRTVRAILLAALATSLPSPPVVAQEPDARSVLVEGHAFNLLTHVPLIGARIEVYRSDAVRPEIYPPPPPTPFAMTFTDANGYYSLELPPRPPNPGLFVYTLVARCTAERLAASNASVSPGRTDEFRRDFYLDVTRRRIGVTCSESTLPGPPPPGPLPPRVTVPAPRTSPR